jgi:enoyl-CoA hydratase
VTQEVLLTERRPGGVLAITLNRPERRNAIDHALAAALAEAIDAYEADDALRAAVLTGAGGTFSAGTDLRAHAAGETMRVGPRGLYGLLDAPPSKPLVAAVEGHAVGGGCELALGCDLVVAARDAVFGIPEVTVGVIAGGGGLVRLARRAGAHRAMELALTGALIDAERAERFGLVNRIVEPGGALAAAVELAAQVAGNAPLAVEASKAVVLGTERLDGAAAWELQAERLAAVLDSEDAREGVGAFIEKRPPVWRGR